MKIEDKDDYISDLYDLDELKRGNWDDGQYALAVAIVTTVFIIGAVVMFILL